MIRRLGALTLSVLLGTGLSACSIFESSGDEERLQGERISVLDLEQKLEPDRGISGDAVQISRPYVNSSWSQAGGTASHAMYHLSLPEDLSEAWSVDIGQGADAEQPILAQPVVADGKVFAMDAALTVSAYDTDRGKKLWSRDLNDNGEEAGAFGGGVAVMDGRIYAATGLGRIHALDAASGETVWTYDVGTPMRGAPAVKAGRVYAVTIINETVAVDAESGDPLWQHQGIEEQAGLLGSASPAVSEASVVSAYSSGQLFSLLNDNGRVLWNDSLAGINRTSRVSNMADIRGLPIVDRGRVFAVSNAGRMVSINLRSGAREWETELASSETPWTAGDYLFVVTTNARVAAVRRSDGKVRWVTQVASYADPENKSGPIYWQGPIVAGDRVIVAGSHGMAASLSPYTGEFLSKIELPGQPTVLPVVADETLYFLTENATLAAFR